MNLQNNEIFFRWISFIFVFFIQLKCGSVKAGRYPGFHPYEHRYPGIHSVPGRDHVDLCETPDKQSGECRALHDCWTSSYTHIQRTSCQFYGNVEFFCCPYQETRKPETLLPVRHVVQPIKTEVNAPIRTIFNPLNVLVNIVVPGLGSLIHTGAANISNESSSLQIHVSKGTSSHTTKLSTSISTAPIRSQNYTKNSTNNHMPQTSKSTTSSTIKQTAPSRRPRSTKQSSRKPVRTTSYWSHNSDKQTTSKWQTPSTRITVHTTPSTITIPSRRPRPTKQSSRKPVQTASYWSHSSVKQTTPRWQTPSTRITAFQPVITTRTTKIPQIYFTSRKPQNSLATQSHDQHPTSQPAVCGRRFVTSSRSTIRPKLEAFILGGSTSEEESWPWMASIHSWNQFGLSRFICGGSLITTRHILTAAHCFDNRNSVMRYTAVLGITNLTLVSDEKSEFHPKHLHVMRIKLHNEYKQRIYYHDIAMLVLAEDVILSSKVSTICLPTTQDLISINPQTPATVAGWGHTSFGGLSSNVLQDAELQIVNFNRCQNSYDRLRTKSLPDGITSNMLCAGKPDGKGDACQGDSGGPLVVEKGNKWIQIGIVSFGYQCGLVEYPGVYTKVSSYLPWIQRILQGK